MEKSQWRVTWGKKGRRMTSTFSTKTEAIALAREILSRFSTVTIEKTEK